MFNNQLPWPADQLTCPFLNIDVNNPPYVVPLQAPQQFQQYLRYLSGMVAMEIQNNAQANPMRVFMFNLCAQNNFYNNDFCEIVSSVLDVVMLGFLKRQFNDVPTAIQNCVPRALEMFTAANCRTYPGLAAYVTDPTAQQAVNQLIQQFTTIGGEIDNMKRMMSNQYGGQGQQQQRGGAGFVHATAGVTNNQQQPSLFSGTSQASAPGFRGSSPTPRNNRWQSKSAVEEISIEADPRNVTKSPFTSSRQSAAAPTAPAKPAAHSNVPFELEEHPLLEVMDNGSYMIPAEDSVVDWVPTSEQPYLPAYNPRTHLLYHQVFSNGKVGVVIKELTKAMMDWEKHNIGGHSFGDRAKVQTRTDMTGVWDDVQTLNHADLAVSSGVPGTEGAEGEQAIDVRIGTNWVLATSIDGFLVDARLNYLRACVDSGQDILAYNAYGSVYSVSVDRVDSSDVIERLGKITEYSVLANKLKGIKGDIADILWYTIDEMLTSAVKRVLRQSLSRAINFDRFSDDIDDVIALLEADGPLLHGAFLKHQAEVIRTTLGSILADHREALDSALDMPNHADLKTTYVGQHVSLTVLDCMSHDLDIELTEGLGAAIVESLTPEMYSLVKGIFERSEEYEQEIGRHLIVTNDLVTLEASRGHLGADFYTLSVLKK
jgi:hypothetical protein